LTELAQEIEAASVGQMQVEQNRIVFHATHGEVGWLQALEPIDCVPRMADMLLHGRAQVSLIFDEQNSHRSVCTPHAPPNERRS
jgi:hypothetical protein